MKHVQDPRWIEDLKKIYGNAKKEYTRDDCHIVQLLNAFIYQGPYGKHFCMVFEILGVNLLEIIKRYNCEGIPLPIVRRMSKQILTGLYYLHKYCGIIDTDLKPENVLMCLDKKELKEIYDKGQLTRHKSIEEKIKRIRIQLKILNNIPVDEEEIKSLSQIKDPEHDNTENLLKNENQEPKDDEDNEIETDANNDSPLVIKNEDDLNREYDRICREKNLGKNERKNLKKALKKKLKRQKEKNENVAAEPPVVSSKSMKNVKPKENKKEKEKKQMQTKEQIEEEEILKRVLAVSGLSPNFNIKIADLGNGCWTHHHFQPEIQTR